MRPTLSPNFRLRMRSAGRPPPPPLSLMNPLPLAHTNVDEARLLLPVYI
jgi:hypothetical protein